MQTFSDAMQAKHYLIQKISSQALEEHVALSEVELKMLYFSETHASLPDMAAATEEFNRSHNDRDYEQKIASLIRKYLSKARGHDTSSIVLWKQAVQVLKREDHYLLVLADLAEGKVATNDADHPWSSPTSLSRMALWVLVGFVILSAVLFCYVHWVQKY